MKAVDDSRFGDADLLPAVICGALNLLRKLGHPPDRYCKGLGFAPEDLTRADIRVSYRQTSLLVRRMQHALRDPAIGLAAGAAQSITSLGLVGFGMLACPTLADAVAFAAEHQVEGGALLLHTIYSMDDGFVLELTPRFFDPDLEPYFVEEALSSSVTFVRALVGARFCPLRLELAYPKPRYAAAYDSFFKCPVRFDMPINRMLTDPKWLQTPLPSYDPYISDSVRARLVSLMAPRDESNDLIEAVSNYLRVHVDEPQAMQGLAKYLNLGERTLRRRLTEMKVSYRALVDRARYERSLELLKRSAMPINEIALATGYGDVSNFRRAFKRWSGALPSEVRGRTPDRSR